MSAFGLRADMAEGIRPYRIRSNTLCYLENVGIQFLSLQQDSIEHDKFAIRFITRRLGDFGLTHQPCLRWADAPEGRCWGTSMGTGLRKI